MRIKQVFAGALAASAMALLLSTSAFAVTLNLHNGGDPRTLDPAKQSGNWEDRPISDAIEGMMTIDAAGEPILGQAASYEISEDGLTYTFTLRDGLTWSNGDPVVAQDFVTGFERLQNPATAAEYAYLSYFIEGAQAYNAGESKDASTLGVKALDDKTVQYKLVSPTPFFLGALAHASLYPVPTKVVEAKGEAWSSIDNIVSNGPFILTEWVPGSHLRSVKNPNYYDAANVKLDEVVYHVITDDAAALNRYRAGELDILTAFPTDQYQLLQNEYPGEAKVAPILAVYYYVMNQENPVLADMDVRKALSTTVNREVIVQEILGTGDLPAYSWVPPGVANYGGNVYMPDWASVPYDERVAQAAEVMASKGYTKDSPLTLQLRHNVESANHARIAVAVSAMWEEIGVKVELISAEVGPHYDALESGDFQIGRAGWIMDYNDASNMLDLLAPGVMQDGKMFWGNNYGRYSNAEYGALLKQASTENDLDARAGHLAAAEKIAMDEFAAIPIYDYVSKWVVSPKVGGWVDNAPERHLMRYFSKTE